MTVNGDERQRHERQRCVAEREGAQEAADDEIPEAGQRVAVNTGTRFGVGMPVEKSENFKSVGAAPRCTASRPSGCASPACCSSRSSASR